MEIREKSVKKNKRTALILALALAVSVIMLVSSISLAWMTSSVTEKGEGVLGNVSLNNPTNITLSSGEVVPGGVLLSENATLNYSGQPAYYRIRFRFELFSDANYQRPIVLDGLFIPDKFGAIDGGRDAELSETIHITEVGHPIKVPDVISKEQAGAYGKITLSVIAIQQEGLPITGTDKAYSYDGNQTSKTYATKEEAAFAWYDANQK